MYDITVIVPCYNGAEFLPQCLDSLLCQKYPVEIIVVNDGSRDDTEMIANNYAEKNEHITVLSKENAGLPQARYSGLLAARTPYIGFVDSDDWAAPELYLRLHEAIVQADADVACGDIINEYPNGKSVPVRQADKSGAALSSSEAMRGLHRRTDVFPYMWNKLYKRAILEQITFPAGSYTGEDYATTIQILEKAQKVVLVNQPLSHYRQTTVSMSRGGFRDAHILAYRSYRDAEKSLLIKYPALQKEIHAYHSIEYMSFVVAMSRNQRYDKQMAKEIAAYVRKQLGSFLLASYNAPLFKLSAIVISIDYRLLAKLYRVLLRVSSKS